MRDNLRSRIGDIAVTRVKPGVYHGRLAEPYDGIGQYIAVSLSRASLSGAFKARIAAGDFGTGVVFPAGTPITIAVYHGRIEILSLGSKGSVRLFRPERGLYNPSDIDCDDLDIGALTHLQTDTPGYSNIWLGGITFTHAAYGSFTFLAGHRYVMDCDFRSTGGGFIYFGNYPDDYETDNCASKVTGADSHGLGAQIHRICWIPNADTPGSAVAAIGGRAGTGSTDFDDISIYEEPLANQAPPFTAEVVAAGAADPGVSFFALKDDAKIPHNLVHSEGDIPDLAAHIADEDVHAVGGSGAVSVLSPSSDTFIDQQATTTNNDTSTILVVGNAWGTASFTRFMLFSFDITALAGLSIANAILHLYRTDATAAGATDRILEARRVIRDYVPAEVTWNIYSTGNNWTTAGARGVGTDIELMRTKGDSVGAAADVDQWHAVDVTKLLQAAIDESLTELRLIVGANINGAGSNGVQFASNDHATASIRPKLHVVK